MEHRPPGWEEIIRKLAKDRIFYRRQAEEVADALLEALRKEGVCIPDEI